MSDTSPAPAAPKAEKHSLIVWVGVLALVVALVALACLGIILVRGLQPKLAMASVPKAVLSPSKATTAKFAPTPKLPKPEIKIALAQIAKVEAAKQGWPRWADLRSQQQQCGAELRRHPNERSSGGRSAGRELA